MARLGIALVGAGFIAEYHLGGLAGIPEAEARVIASRSLASARAVAERFGVREATDDVAGTLRRPDIDAVILTTPDDTHEALAIEALTAGRHVLIQKPMATSAVACRRILDAAARAGRDCQVSFMHRHFPEIDVARALIAEGRIGRVTTVRLRNATPGPDWGDWFFRKEAVSGGVVFQLGIHGIDLIGHLFGPVAMVSARTATLVPTRTLRDGRVVTVENADTAFALHETRSGILVHHEMSMIEAAGTDRFRMEIHGTTGTLWLRTEHGALASATAADRRWTTHPLPEAPMGHAHHRRWIDGLLGHRPRETTAQDALRGLAVAEAIAVSSARGGAVTPVEVA